MSAPPPRLLDAPTAGAVRAGLQLATTKAAYTTRHVRLETAESALPAGRPAAGDLVLAEVSEIGQHARLELCNGRKAMLYERDRVIVAYGNRYAPDQFEAVVPDDLGPCDLVAAGGVAGRLVSQHAKMSSPTRLEPIGLLVDGEGATMNVRDGCLGAPARGSQPWTIVVTGSTMNAGKTTTAAAIVRGAVRAGCSVAAGKVTGTGAGGDVWLLTDAGADPVLDFTAAGYCSTYRCSPEEVVHSLQTVHGHLASTSPDVVVLEIADGLLQRETAQLLASTELAEIADSVVFAACDALGALSGVTGVRELGLPIAAVSGVVTASLLGIGEVRSALDLPVLTPDELIADPSPVLARTRDLAASSR